LSGPVHTNRLKYEAMVDWLEIKSNFAMIVGKSTDGKGVAKIGDKTATLKPPNQKLLFFDLFFACFFIATLY
jgi:hypothetical protein